METKEFQVKFRGAKYQIKADWVFSMLMGDEVTPRREFIEQNAKYAEIDA